jgi:phosphatidylserine/phosphatidylglycerophosphate/cardiolipin synthase-like enzyme
MRSSDGGDASATTPAPTLPDEHTVERWLLSARERGNRASELSRGRGWTSGNGVVPLIDGATYFARLSEELGGLRRGDRVFIADWRGDEDEIIVEGVTLGELLTGLVRRGVEVRGLLWRSHPRIMGFQEETQVELARAVNEAGGELLLDERVRRGGSHHQKFVMIERDGRPEVAFVGGIDLCHGRRDRRTHEGDPQRERLDAIYGERPGWHDVQVEIRGPALGDLATTFRERWNDRTPVEQRSSVLDRVRVRLAREPTRPEPFPAPARAGANAGSCAVQVLRTYPEKRPPFPFAPRGERTIARLYRKALERARRLVYVEDQYLWSEEVASVFAAALARAPELRLISVVPRFPERNSVVSGPVYRQGQERLLRELARAGGDRVAVYDLQNDGDHPIYVHAKAVIVDDVLAVVGSDNLNRRSWTHDSELSVAVLDDELDNREPRDPGGLGDGARRFARQLRLDLWREHLGLAEGDDAELLDPVLGFRLWRSRASALDAWYRSDRAEARPPGQVRHHSIPESGPWRRMWAEPLHRLLVDPDGRPRAMRRARRI